MGNRNTRSEMSDFKVLLIEWQTKGFVTSIHVCAPGFAALVLCSLLQISQFTLQQFKSLLYHHVGIVVPYLVQAPLFFMLKLPVVPPNTIVSPLGDVPIAAAALHEPLRPLVPGLIVHGQGSLDPLSACVVVSPGLHGREELCEEQGILDAEAGTSSVVGAARVGGVAGQTDDALGVSGDGVVQEVEYAPFLQSLGK